MKKLAIVGSHIDTRHLAPFDDPDYEIWVFNEAAMMTPEYYPDVPERQWCKRWDVCFQLHKPEVYASENNWQDSRHWEWLQKEHGDKIIYMQGKDERVPNSKKYPLDRVLNLTPRKQITSSVSYALALALLSLDYDIIDVYGVELSSNSEYSYQLPNWAYWVGYADGVSKTSQSITGKPDLKLNLHSGNVHFSERLYGYDGELQINKEYYTERQVKFDALWEDCNKLLLQQQQKVKSLVFDRKIKKLPDAIQKIQGIAIECGQYSGAQAEAEKYLAKEDVITRQEFEQRSAFAAKEGESKNNAMYQQLGKTEFMMNTFFVSVDIGIRDNLLLMIGELVKLAYETGTMNGIYKENLEYMKEYDERVQAAGGNHTLKALGVIND